MACFTQATHPLVAGSREAGHDVFWVKAKGESGPQHKFTSQPDYTLLTKIHDAARH
jgi:hypothetical protein